MSAPNKPTAMPAAIQGPLITAHALAGALARRGVLDESARQVAVVLEGLLQQTRTALDGMQVQHLYAQPAPAACAPLNRGCAVPDCAANRVCRCGKGALSIDPAPERRALGIKLAHLAETADALSAALYLIGESCGSGNDDKVSHASALAPTMAGLAMDLHITLSDECRRLLAPSAAHQGGAA